MLTELRLNSLGVVAEAVLPLGPGLTALTGETGAGKTMIVAGLGLLLGARADASLVRNGQDRALVQGRWEVGENTAEAVEALGGDLDDGVELVTLRQISSQGRSRATVGGVQVPVSTAALRASTRAKAFSSVDLPHPLGPMSIVSSPSGTSSVMSSITIFRS